MIAATGTVPPLPADSATPKTPDEALALLADRRVTGALRGPLGSLHLVDGQVTAAESPRAPGLADLLTGCGRITPERWAELLRLHGSRSRVGEALVEQRLITRGELELGHLGTLFDAAFFVLADSAGGVWRFEADARHWLGPVAEVSPARICREVERRRQLLDRIWPWGLLDATPVRPVERGRPVSHRPPGRRRRELLDHADGRRTPADLARLLGRSGFGVTADVRRLAAAGLLDTPRPTAAAPTPAPAAEVPPPAAPAAEAPAPVADGPVGGLHRRVPGASLRGATPADTPTRSERPPTTAAAHPLAVPDPDVALLTRVRNLLEARL
ncbi:transcriptional regulator [Kitasatospora brasiliensis]|uniref:transcriptional regulator n=1 Tax=Kitasatospora brasiliensis TaxID=3058040 RepID=UPI002930292F|nr:transcriptional regulator [Kitasatospora sp. K002]